MKLPGSPAIATTTSLSAVNRTWAGGVPLPARLIGCAPLGPSLVTNVTPRSGTRQLMVRSTRCCARSLASISAMRLVRLSRAARHCSAVAIRPRFHGHSVLDLLHVRRRGPLRVVWAVPEAAGGSVQESGCRHRGQASRAESGETDGAPDWRARDTDGARART